MKTNSRMRMEWPIVTEANQRHFLQPSQDAVSLGSNFDLEFLSAALGEHAIVSVADVKGRISFVNDKFVEISGYARDELIGQNHRMLKSDEHPDEFFKEMWHTIARGKTWQGEIKNFRKSGAPYWVKATIVPFCDDRNKPVKYLSIRTDITEVKAAERMRLRQDSFDLIETEIYMIWPDTLRIFYANKTARDRWSQLGAEPKGLTPLHHSTTLTEEKLRQYIAPLLAGDETSVVFQGDITLPGNKTYPGEVMVQMIKPLDETPRLFMSIRNITERRKAEKAKAAFIASVSHELRTPLTSIAGSIQLIRASLRTGKTDKIDHVLDIASRNGERLKTLIDDILDLEKLDAGKMSFEIAPLNVSDLIRESIAAVSGYQPEKNVHIRALGTDLPILVPGDYDRLLQVMANLLSNAIKFSPVEGDIVVRLVEEAHQIRVSVTDNGRGIPEEARSGIFEKFVQAEVSDGRRTGGTGLGLPIAKEIVKAHGGTIDFDTTVNVGTTFHFTLPRSDNA